MLRMNMVVASSWAILFLLSHQLLMVIGLPASSSSSSYSSSSSMAHNDKSQQSRLQEPLELVRMMNIPRLRSEQHPKQPVERRKVVQATHLSQPPPRRAGDADVIFYKLLNGSADRSYEYRSNVMAPRSSHSPSVHSSDSITLNDADPPGADIDDSSLRGILQATITTTTTSRDDDVAVEDADRTAAAYKEEQGISLTLHDRGKRTELSTTGTAKNSIARVETTSSRRLQKDTTTDSPSQAPSIIPTTATTETATALPTMEPTTTMSLPPAATQAPSNLTAESSSTMTPTAAPNKEVVKEELCACSFTSQISDNDPCRVYGGDVDPNEFKLTAWYRANDACLIDLKIVLNELQHRAQLYELCRPINDDGGGGRQENVLLDVDAFIQLARNGGDDDNGDADSDYIPLSDRIKNQFLNRGYFVKASDGSIVLAAALTTVAGGKVLDCTDTPDLCWDEIEIDMREKAKRFQFICDNELAAMDTLLNEEQKTVRTQLCSLIVADDVQPESCDPLATQIQQVLTENPNADCSDFGKGPRQEPVPFCENAEEEYVSNAPSSHPSLLPSELYTNSSTIPTFMPSDLNNTSTDSGMPSNTPSDAPSQRPTHLSDVNATTLAPSTQPPTLPPTVEPEPGTPLSFRLFGISMILRGVGNMDTAARDIWIETTIKFYENVHNNGTVANMTATPAERQRQLQTSIEGKIRDFATLITFQTQNTTAEGNTLLYTQQVSYERIGSAPTTTAELLQEPFRNETLNRQYAEALRSSGHEAFTKLPTNDTAVSVPLVPQTPQDNSKDGDANDDKDGLSTVVIAGIAIGGFACLVFLLYVCQYCCCRGRKKNGGGGGGGGSRQFDKGSGNGHRDDYHDEHDNNNNEGKRGGYPTPHIEALGKIKKERKSRDEDQRGGDPNSHSEVLSKIKKDRKSRRRRSQIDERDDDSDGDQKFTDYENKIIYGANDKNNFEDDGKNNDVNDLNCSVQFSDQDISEMVPPSPGLASCTAPNEGHHPNEHYVEIEAPAGTLGLTIDTPDFEGAPFIQDIDDDSVLFGKMLVGDRIVALDGEDVSDMTAQQVSRLISRKSLQKCRKFQVLRKNEATHRNKHSTWDMPHDEEPSESGGLV